MNRYDALAEALAEVWSGADTIDAEAVLDHLADRGYEVVQIPGSSRVPMSHEELPFASTRGLPKRRSV